MYISVDIEADGPIPSDYSMLSLGAVVIEPKLDRTFYAEFRPISDSYKDDALKACGFTRAQTLNFPPTQVSTDALDKWLTSLYNEDKRLIFVSDNPIFDGSFVFYYLHHFVGRCLFGFSGFSLTSFAKGWERSMSKNHKKYRKTTHTHNALDDAKGNAEAFLTYQGMGLKLY